MRISVYPIYGLAREFDYDPFDKGSLPFQILPDVTIEDVTPLINEETWGWVRNAMGRDDFDHFINVRYAIVHRYDVQHGAIPSEEVNADHESETLVRTVAALVRLVRPMRQFAMYMRGVTEKDGKLNINHFEHPIELMEVPEIQKLFHLRMSDAIAVRAYAPDFIQAMAGNYWKFRMAVEFHEAGHFQQFYWKARYLLWCSGLESIYTTEAPEHRGTRIAKERIKALIGGGTKLYPKGDLPSCFVGIDSNLRVHDVLGDLYQIRNHLAHGDKIPDSYFERKPRQGINGELNVAAVCTEALSFILRTSLLSILSNSLLGHFADASTAENFYTSMGLINSLIPRP